MYLRKDYGDYKIIQTGKRTQEHLYVDNEGRILFLGEYSNYKKKGFWLWGRFFVREFRDHKVTTLELDL